MHEPLPGAVEPVLERLGPGAGAFVQSLQHLLHGPAILVGLRVQ